jgi:HAD superfamily hydrolase (TIGR01509 family)
MTAPTAPDSQATWGAIFDWDGVIINSARHHEESWELLAVEENRILPSDHFTRSFGMKNATIIPELLGWTRDPAEIERISLRKEVLYRQVLAARGVELLPGVLPFLQFLKKTNVPCVIGSSTHRLNITTTFDHLNLWPYFVDITSAEEVNRGKPDPEVFLAAAGKIHRSPERCVVFEDAHVGVQAARSAGMRVVAVTTTHPAADFKDANLVVNQLDSIPHDIWDKWFPLTR